MKTILLLCVMATAAATSPSMATEHCSIHPAKGTSDTQLTKLAKLTKTEAEKLAVAKLASKQSVSAVSAELEAEDGCLMWSFDFRIEGKSGVEEIQVDAGNGKILAAKHETAQQEAKEH